MKLTRMKISLLCLLVVSAACVTIQSGCEKPKGPEHQVAMTSVGPDKPVMEDVRPAEDTAEYPAEDTQTPEPVGVNQGPLVRKDPTPLTEIDRSQDDTKYYRIKAGDTFIFVRFSQLIANRVVGVRLFKTHGIGAGQLSIEQIISKYAGMTILIRFS